MQLFDDDFVAILPGANEASSSSTTTSGTTTPLTSLGNNSGHLGGSKACLFTLLAYAKNFEQSIHCHELVRLIAKKYPCKIILTSIEPTTSDSFHVERTMYKNSANGAPNTFIGEVITITSSPDQMHRVPFSLLPEIVPDLPLYVIANDRPSQCEQFLGPLLNSVTKIIFEPDSMSGYPAFAQEILSSLHLKKYVDINWIKLKPWREAIFRIFDDKEKIKHIKQATSISLRYSKHPSKKVNIRKDSQAIYLQAWLSQCLDWRMVSMEEKDDKFHISFSHDAGPLSFDITPFDSAVVEEGGILSLEIAGADETHYLISYEQDDRHIVVHSSTPDRCEMPFVIFVGSFQRGHLLGNELFTRPQEDVHYIDTLKQFFAPEWKKSHHAH